MSKTYKHQRKYNHRKWWRTNDPYSHQTIVKKDGFLYLITIPPQPCERCPFPDWLYYEDDSRKSNYYRLSYQKLRHKWTRLLYENDEYKIGSESLKPENQDWNID